MQSLNQTTAWLNRPVAARTALPWVFLLVVMPLQVRYGLTAAHIVFDTIRSIADGGYRSHAVIGNDFLVFWSVGRMLITDQSRHIYDSTSFMAWQAEHIRHGINSYLVYFYPPTGIVLPFLIGRFPFMVGFAIWTCGLTTTAIAALRWAQVPWPVIILGTLTVPCLYNLIAGQMSWMVDWLFIAGLLITIKSPLRAAGLFGLIAIKPQAGLLAPIIILSRGAYRAVPMGLGVAFAIAIIATIIAGVSVWPDYIADGLPAAHRLLVAPFPNFYEERGISVFWMARSFGATVQHAAIAQVVSAIGAGLWCWRAWRNPPTDHIALVALTASLTLFVTPYAYTTDLCGFTLMVGWLAWCRRRLEFSDVLMWIWPALSPLIATSLHMELTPLILLLGAVRAWRRLGGIGMAAPACYPIPL